MSYCNNCGRKSHCGSKISEDAEDGLTGESYSYEICRHCRCENCTKTESEKKQDELEPIN
jgi:hypothetical protein